MMGLWFLATSLGNLIAGLAAGRLTSEDPAQMPQLFLVMVGTAALVGLVLLVLTKPIKKLMAAWSEAVRESNPPLRDETGNPDET